MSSLTMTDDTLLAELDKDYYAERYGEATHVGTTQWTYAQVVQFCDSDDVEQFIPQPHKTRWRLKDDDGEVYYGGWLYDDPLALMQQLVLEWGKYDSGCTMIEVKRNDEWTMDIG
jgi:hypothetical protein